MDEAKRVMVQKWLIKAQHDLASAQRLAEGDDPLFDTAVYHCQQAAEKAVKGYLVYSDVRVRKTHDLTELILETARLTTDYAALDNAGKRLTEYATQFRYLGMQMEPTKAEYEQAYQDAALFMSVTLGLIPVEAHPA
ncbi:MAG: HEPN domain-containing protein [Janthinobacterium lividum]